MKRISLCVSLFLILSTRSAFSQTTGPYALDKVVTATGIGSPSIGPLTPSEPNELAFLVVGADYSTNSACSPDSSYLTSMSAPWVWAGTGNDNWSIFTGNPNVPFYIGGVTYSSGPSAPRDYPFWAFASGPISTSSTSAQE